MFTLTARPNILAVWLLLCATASASWYEPAWTNYRFAESNLYATNLWAVYTNRVTSGEGYTNTFVYPTMIASWSNVAGMVQTQMLLQAADVRSFDVFRAIDERNSALTFCGPTAPAPIIVSYYRSDYSNLVMAKSWIKNNADSFADYRLADESGRFDTWFAASNFYIPELSPTALIAIVGVRTSFFEETSWRQGYSPTSDWHAIRLMLTNLVWALEDESVSAAGYKESNADGSVEVHLTDDWYGEYGDWVSNLCGTAIADVSADVSRGIPSNIVIMCGNTFPDSIGWSYVSWRWAGLGPVDAPWFPEYFEDDCDNTNIPQQFEIAAGYYGEKNAFEWASLPYLIIHTSVPLIEVDSYAFYPQITGGDVCLGGGVTNERPRPYYLFHLTMDNSSDYVHIDYEPADWGISQINDFCSRSCLSPANDWAGASQKALFVYPADPSECANVFSSYWPTIEFSEDNEDCNVCIWDDGYQDQNMNLPVFTALSNLLYSTYGCRIVSSGLGPPYVQWRDFYTEEAEEREIDWTAHLDAANDYQLFLYVIKYDWEYE